MNNCDMFLILLPTVITGSGHIIYGVCSRPTFSSLPYELEWEQDKEKVVHKEDQI